MLFNFKSILFILLCLFFFSLPISLSSNNDKPCCSKKCTGSEYCSACKNCSRCGYCNSGGYCGVCRPEAFIKPVKKTTVKPKAKQQVKPNTSVKKNK